MSIVHTLQTLTAEGRLTHSMSTQNTSYSADSNSKHGKADKITQ